MFLSIQKKMNYILIILFVLTAIILYGMYYLITQYTNWGMIGIIVSFVLVTIIIHLILSFIEKHIETFLIYRMVAKKKIALAKINKATFYKMHRDIYFQQHNIYEFEIELYTQNHKKIKTVIYEDVAKENSLLLPSFSYVTYDENNKKIGIIPTFLLFMSPKLKDIVKDFEDKYHPHYAEISKKKGLTIKKFSNK